MGRSHALLLAAGLALCSVPGAGADAVEDLGRDFWAWRQVHAPLAQNNDDIWRIERTPDWRPDFSAATVAARRQAIADFERRWKALDASSLPVPRQVDHRLLGSAVSRARWEMDVSRMWQRNPMFYLDHTIGAVRERLIPPPPFSATRGQEIVRRMDAIPAVIEQAKANLTDVRAPFARFALDALKDIRPRWLTVVREVKPLLPAEAAGQLDASTENAVVALESFASWLQERLPGMPAEMAIGRDGYVFYLHRIALLPYTPEEMRALARQYRLQAEAGAAVEAARNKGMSGPAPSPTQAAVIARADYYQREARRLLDEKGLLTVPASVSHYRLAPMPPYLAPIIAWSLNDPTYPSRASEDSVYYIFAPGTGSGSSANPNTYIDPRMTIAHTGIPGHKLQANLGWAHEDPLRRHAYSSTAMEGIAYYSQLLLLRAGFFDDNPRLRQMVFGDMAARTRTLINDLDLQLGEVTFEQFSKDRTVVPGTAGNPGNDIGAFMGEIQITEFMGDARIAQADKFDLRAFHDFLWKNGNVPVSLLRWEHLGARDQVDRLDALVREADARTARPRRR